MPTPTYFPQLANGATTQLPLVTRQEFATIVSDMPTGKRYTYPRLANPLGRWEVNFPALSEANLAIHEAFFEQQRGQLLPFTFLDPAGNLCAYSEDFTNAAWTKVTLTLGAAVADPFGGTGATSITGTGADSHLSCDVLPEGGADGWTLCGSVWAKAASASQTLPIALADGGVGVLGAPLSWELPQGQWKRILFGMELTETGPIKLLIGGYNSWVSTKVISLFGAQCAPLPGPGAYAKSPGNYGLHSKCRFDTDRFDATANDYNSWSLKLPIQEYA